MRVRLDGLWRHPDFLKLWTGQTISVFGSLITGSALPFTAILALDATPFEVAVLAAARLLPGMLVGFHAGVWVDRLRRRPVMIASDIGRALLLATVPIAYAFDALRIEQLYVVAFTTGVLTMFFDVAYQSYLPTLVTKEDLVEGNSKMAATNAASEFAGFSVSGWLVQAITGPGAVLVDAVTFVVSAVFVRTIRAPEPAPAPPEARTSVFEETRDGLRAVRGEPVLRALAVAVPLYSFGFGIFFATYMLFVTRGLGFEPGVLGLIFGLGGISSLAGAVLAGRAAERLGTGPAMVLGLALMGLSMLLIPVAREAGALAAVLLIAQQLGGDGAFVVQDVNAVSLRQSIAPERMLGRINAFMRMLELTATLTGVLAGGLMGGTVGLRPALLVGGLTVLGAAGWLYLSPARAVRQVAAEAVPSPAGHALSSSEV